MAETEAITLARRAYNKAGDLLDKRTAERETAKQALADAVARMNSADEAWDTAASTVDKTFQVLRDLVAELRADDDLPEYDPDDAAAQRIAEEFADATEERHRIEAEEAHDAAGEAWYEAAYQPGVSDPAETSGPRGLA